MHSTSQNTTIDDRDTTIQALHAEIENLRAALYRSTTDELTGLHNRRWLRQFWAQFACPESVIGAVAYIDVDLLKPINDRYGHKTGDRVITHVAAAIIASGCYGVRLGGDEFFVLIPAAWDVEATMTRIVKEIDSRPVSTPDGDALPIVVSCGVRTVDGPDLSQMMDDADQAMYVIKRERTGGCQYVAS